MEENQQQKKTKRYVTISFVLHLSVFVLASIGSFFAPKALLFTPAVQIDMVALPNQTKNQDAPPIDTSLPVKDKEPPPPAPEPEAKPEAKPEPKPEPIKAPTKPAVDEMALERKKEKEAEKRAKEALKKMREQAAKERKEEEEKRQESVNKKKADLKRFEEAYRQAQRGNQKNEGTSSSGAMEATKNAYYGHVSDKVRSNWTLPSFLQNKGLRAEVRVQIDARGNISAMSFTQVSGNNLFDTYVENTLKKSSPFFPPPAEMASSLKNTGFILQFPL